MPPIRRKRKSKSKAPAVVHFTQGTNEGKKNQLCVYAECMYSGQYHGPVWSHTRQAVARVLAELSTRCDCGRKFHRHERSEGARVVTNPSS